MIFMISSNFVALSFKILSEIIFLVKSLLSKYVASSTKQALSNLFLHKCVKLPVYINFWTLSQCLANGPQEL